jgi:hypothetical protein
MRKQALRRFYQRVSFVDMEAIKFCVYMEVPHYVAQCLNVDVASFGDTSESAITNLKEALELYFEDVPEGDIITLMKCLWVKVSRMARLLSLAK